LKRIELNLFVCLFVCFREKKDLELSQVRQNIEDSKRLGSEKNIRNKSELDRRVRELKSNNTKKFVEERKRQTMKHEREKDNLTKSHEIQKTTLLDEIDKVFCLHLKFISIKLFFVSFSRDLNIVLIIKMKHRWHDFHLRLYDSFFFDISYHLSLIYLNFVCTLFSIETVSVFSFLTCSSVT